MEHSFDIEIAKEYGIQPAILLKNIYFWISKNRANETNYFDGNYWTYNSKKAFAELFPYMNARQIDYALKKLIDDGILITGNYNKMPYDRTLWYAITEKGYCILQKCEMGDTKLQNGSNDNAQPIPNNNPASKQSDNKPANKKESKKASYDEILEKITDAELKELYGDFIQMRVAIKAPMTNRALQMLIDKVNQLEPTSIDRQKKLLENAIINNWKSVYPLKDENDKKYGATGIAVKTPEEDDVLKGIL